MFTIQDVAQVKPEAYNRVNEELSNMAACQLHDVHRCMSQAISLIWLLPKTEKREELREKLYEIYNEYYKFLNEELTAYREEK